MAGTTLAELVQHLDSQGITCQVVGDDGVEVCAVNTLEDAGPGDLSFLTNPKYRRQAQGSEAAAILVGQGEDLELSVPLVRCSDPYAALSVAAVLLHGYRRHPRWGVSEGAVISPSAEIGPDASIASGVTIGHKVVIGRNAVIYPGTYIAENVTIGDDVVLYPNVTIYDDSRLGDRVTIHAGTVIGEDGLGYAPVGSKWMKIPQVGRVVVGDDVEIGSNCCIDRATVGTTRIGSGTKFSNLVAIGHGTKIGRDCMLVALVGIAGSASVGDHVTIAGQAGVVGHIHIGDNARVGAQAGVVGDIPDGLTVLGSPASPINDAKRQFIMSQRLPEMSKRIKELENQVKRLVERLEGGSDADR